MPTIGSITKTIRINPRDLEVIEELMRDGTTWSGAIHKLCEGVPTITKEESKGVPETKHQISEEVYRDISTMCDCYKVATEDFFEQIRRKMEIGEIDIEGGEVVFRKFSGVDTERFENACAEKGVDPNKMMERATQMVWMS